jgi:hypothetical protein
VSRAQNYQTDTSAGLTYFVGYFLPSLGTGNASATLALYDSGGGTFINVNGTWELAGVNYGTNAFYSGPGNGTTSPNGAFPSPFGGAALWDQSGFTSSGQPVTGPQPWAVTNISPDVAHNILTAVPEPSSLFLIASGLVTIVSAEAMRRRSRLRGCRSPSPADPV